jgi:uncharacterized protein YjiS (DUF1127 family)
MAFQLSSERPGVAAAPVRGAFAAVAGWLAAQRINRRRRMTLQSLLEFDDARLRDIGIRRSDLFDALEQDGVRAGSTLAQRRASRSRAWLDGSGR